MRAWQITSFGLDGLRLAELPEPTPGPGQLLLGVRAVSLNRRDLMTVQGAYNPRQPLPLVPCSDAVAEVLALGPGVDDRAVGERVIPLFSQSWIDGPPTDAALRGTLGGPLDGTLRERMVVDARAVVPAPAHLTDAEAACLPCAGVTAYRALVTVAGIGPGQAVLALGTGGVSVFAAQIARALGARVALTSSSAEKLTRLAPLGLDLGIHTAATPAWGKAARVWAGGGVDCVVEVGGATLAQSLDAVRTGGTIALIGVLGGGVVEVPLTRVLMRSIRVQGVFVGDRDDLVGLCELLAAHPDARPVVDAVVPFDEAPAAFSRLDAQGHVGKIVVSLP